VITKILLAAIILSLIFLRGYVRTQRSTRAPIRPVAQLRAPEHRTRRVAYAIIGILVMVTAAVYYRAWHEGHQVVTVRVINTTTGAVDTYRARKGDIQQHYFETIDGRAITSADVERIEVIEPSR
jgi:hypothetical protein